MKALIRKYGFTPTTEEQNEVFLSSNWPKWINSNGWPLTEENYGYAICEDCPNLEKYDVEDFEIIENVITKYENNKKISVKSWRGYYNPKR